MANGKPQSHYLYANFWILSSYRKILIYEFPQSYIDGIFYNSQNLIDNFYAKKSPNFPKLLKKSECHLSSLNYYLYLDLNIRISCYCFYFLNKNQLWRRAGCSFLIPQRMCFFRV